MWGFLKRQWNTKTGKVGLTTIVTTGLGIAFGTVTAATGAPVIAVAVMGVMLRDKEAKKEAEDGEK
jgi:F0F1-type ATP synthase membrane subunit c/vacuolar-type H+-ATPase subunit K